MGRGCALGALLLGVVAAVSGCAHRAGIDGDLTNNWSAFPAATPALPGENACYRTFASDPDRFNETTRPVACTAMHDVETVHVGTFTGAPAAADEPPEFGDDAIPDAYADCADHARTFLGDDWRAGRVRLYVTVPRRPSWTAGARWYRCDLVAYRDLDLVETEVATHSLRGALAGARPYARGCANLVVSDNKVQTTIATACGSGHNGEFAGVYDLPAGTAPTAGTGRDLLKGCEAVVARYAGVPHDGNLVHRTGVVAIPPSANDWVRGDHGAWCYIWRNRTVTGSAKGAGPNGLPVH